MPYRSNDRQYLVMFTIPILLSMVFGFSNDALADSRSSEREGVESRIEESTKTPRQDKSSRRSESAHLESISGIQNVKTLSKKQQMQYALESDNYEWFLKLVTDTPFVDIIDEGAFKTLVQEYTQQKVRHHQSHD